MKYLVTTFKIIPNSEIARDLLASIAAEAGFETFEESDEGMKGYVQESLFAADVLDDKANDHDEKNDTQNGNEIHSSSSL